MSLEPSKAGSLHYVLANICKVPNLEGHVSIGNVCTSFALGMQGVLEFLHDRKFYFAFH